MNRILKYRDRYELLKRKKSDLEEEYNGKKRGKAYDKRFMQISNQASDTVIKLRQIGTQGIIFRITGYRYRPSKKTPKIKIKKRFEVHYTNVSEDEALALVKIHVENIISYKLARVIPGVVED